MNNFETCKMIIQKLTGDGNIMAVNRFYMEYMDSLEGGVFLSQVIFWSDKSSRKDGYFYKSQPEWKAETYLSEYQVRKLTKVLKDEGILDTKLIKANGSPTLHYKFEFEKFVEKVTEKHNQSNTDEHSLLKNSSIEKNASNTDEHSLLKNLSMDNENLKDGNLKISDSLTEITTEITTEIKERDKATPSDPYSKVLKYIRDNRIFIIRDVHTGMIINMVDEYLDADLVIEALNRSKTKGNILAYAQSILRDWKSKSIFNLKHLEEVESQNRKAAGNYGKQKSVSRSERKSGYEAELGF